jgi:hypothetical protein
MPKGMEAPKGWGESDSNAPAPAPETKKRKLEIAEEPAKKSSVGKEAFNLIESSDEERTGLMNDMLNSLPKKHQAEAELLLRGKITGSEDMKTFQAALAEVKAYYVKLDDELEEQKITDTIEDADIKQLKKETKMGTWQRVKDALKKSNPFS